MQPTLFMVGVFPPSAARAASPHGTARRRLRRRGLQVIVRGFWHPTGHIADYYLRYGRPNRGVALQAHAVATAAYLGAPSPAAGMAAYGLACAQAQAGLAGEAARTLASAVLLNPDLRQREARSRSGSVAGRWAARGDPRHMSPLPCSRVLTRHLAVLEGEPFALCENYYPADVAADRPARVPV